MKYSPLFPLLCLSALPLLAQEPETAVPDASAGAEQGSTTQTAADDAPQVPADIGSSQAPPVPPRAQETPPARDPHEGLPQRENEIPLEFSEVDVDGDGRLSAAEALVAFPRELVLVDVDEDGLLSRDEVSQTLPGVRFPEEQAGDQPIGEEEYLAILEEVTEIVEEEAGLESRGTAVDGEQEAPG